MYPIYLYYTSCVNVNWTSIYFSGSLITLSVSFETLEIGSLCHYTPCAVKCLTITFSMSKQLAKNILSKLSKISIACTCIYFSGSLITLSVSFETLEIGSLCHYTPCAVKCLTITFSMSKQLAKNILSKLSKISIACSYHIFNSRNSLSWNANKPFYTL